MAEITAAMVKQLREQTGVGMMECKKALAESDGDAKRAVALLREKGAAKVVKRAGRATEQGLVAAATTGDGRVASLVEVGVETDFVARNERFVQLVDAAVAAALAGRIDSVEALLAATSDGDTIQALVTDAIAVIGENMGVQQCRTFAMADGQPGLVQTYIHPPGKIGVMVELACEADAVAAAPATAELAKDLWLQIAFSNPVGLDRDSVPADAIEAEREIYRNQALKDGKPEKIIDRIVEGRLKAYFKESCLLEQGYVREDKKSVGSLVAETAKTAGGTIEISRFVRFQLGA